jgi:two-component system KDP operon response regulator KdpE
MAANGDEGLDLAASKAPDLIVLDIAMPGKSGFDVCQELREWSKTPIIILSVRDNEEDKIKALDLGADDFLTKPFGIRELLARMRAVLRRSSADEDKQESHFVCENLSVDFAHRTVTLNGQEIHLTPKEYDLLSYLVNSRDRVLTHRQLLSKIWGPEYENDSHTLRVHIANLRNKIEEHPERPGFIHTETRIGYRFRSVLPDHG